MINALFIGENMESCDMCTCPESGSKMDPCGSYDHFFAFSLISVWVLLPWDSIYQLNGCLILLKNPKIKYVAWKQHGTIEGFKLAKVDSDMS